MAQDIAQNQTQVLPTVGVVLPMKKLTKKLTNKRSVRPLPSLTATSSIKKKHILQVSSPRLP